MRDIVPFLVIFACGSSVAIGQISPDEAYQKLHERQRAATTQPATTQPSAPKTAEQRLKDAKARVVASLEKTPTYQNAIADLKVKDAELSALPQSATAKDRLEKSGEWNKARILVEKMKSDAFKVDPDVVKIATEIEVAVAVAEKAKTAPPKNVPPNLSPPRVADDHLEIGMSIDQVEAMSKKTMRLVAEQAGGIKVYESMIGPMKKIHFLGPNDNRDYWMAHKYTITFQDGSLVQYVQSD